ncbi:MULTISPECIES: tol-pal system YbgF family protein [unclassified Alcanivorax]|jgi:F0F1-type ATP synthase membrane subunit b/b'|uniref:tetratricopeptide repeat protein n=1 Tax=unclassified Alcanivorax TaxID=2638842 RepID=UPI00017EE89D|nr:MULTISPECIES: tetratricopeptide repeat protein [unclassified Alcanivorax]EDX89458.1 tetratricopeptide repeat domain protein [Alcanivorax sp. DG881]
MMGPFSRAALASLTLTLLPLASMADSACLSAAPFAASSSSLAISQDDEQLLDLLGHQATTTQARTLLAYNQHASSINKPILGNYARLRLAALALKDGDTAFARQQLSEVEQNSPAAVDAAFLLAESYRRDGDEERARAWFIRIAARFPGNPRAVSGLVLAGDDWRNQGADALALPVYNLALTKAAENLNALDQLSSQPEQLYRTLTNTVAGNSTTVMDQLVLAMVRDNDSQVLTATRQLIAAHHQQKCLDRRETDLHNAIQHATARDLTNGAFRTAAKREKTATEQEIADLQRILQNAPDADELNAQLVDAQERLERLNTRLNKLGGTALPAALQQRKDQLAREKQQVESNLTDARRRVREALQAQLPELETFYRNLAGEAQLGKAQLLQKKS